MDIVKATLGTAVCSALLCGCGSKDDDSSFGPPPAGNQVETSAYLTDEGKIFVVPIVGGGVSAPQEAGDGLAPGIARINARKVCSGTFSPSSNVVSRAHYTDAVFLTGSE